MAWFHILPAHEWENRSGQVVDVMIPMSRSFPRKSGPNKHKNGMSFIRGITGRKGGLAPAFESSQMIHPATTGISMWIPGWFSKGSVAPLAHLAWAQPA